MDNPSCEWTRARLPLCLGAGAVPDTPAEEAVDLGAEDRRAIGRHLAGCPECRRHRSELAGALGALAFAARALPVAPDAPSLWPGLERRIAERATGGEPAGARDRQSADGPAAIGARLDDDRPLRSAWMQDTVREVVEALGLGPWPGSGRAGLVPAGSWRVVGVSLAASVLMVMVVVPVSWRLRAGAEERMLADAEPIPAPVGPPAWLAPSSMDLEALAAVPDEDRIPPAGELARVESARPPSGPSPVADAPPPAASKPEASSLLGYDLERGNPMPPDGRDAQSIY